MKAAQLPREAPAAFPRPRARLPLARGSSAEHGAKPRGSQMGQAQSLVGTQPAASFCHWPGWDSSGALHLPAGSWSLQTPDVLAQSRPPPAPTGSSLCDPTVSSPGRRQDAEAWSREPNSPHSAPRGAVPTDPSSSFRVRARDRDENGPQSLWETLLSRQDAAAVTRSPAPTEEGCPVLVTWTAVWHPLANVADDMQIVSRRGLPPRHLKEGPRPASCSG